MQAVFGSYISIAVAFSYAVVYFDKTKPPRPGLFCFWESGVGCFDIDLAASSIGVTLFTILAYNLHTVIDISQ